MPSGAKKRKAAKKKKEKETNTNNPQGEDELKPQDEKGSDGDNGEGGSPAYRDHQDDHQFNDRSEEVEVSNPSASVAKSFEDVPNDSKIDETEGGKEGVDVIEWDMKSEESCESKDVSAVHNEYAKESNYENGNTGGSNDKTVDTKNSRDEPYNSVEETVAFDELDSSVKEAVNSVAESSADSVKAVTCVSEMKSRDTGNVLPEKSAGSRVGETDLAMKRNEDKVHPLPEKKMTLEEPETKKFDSKVSSTVSRSPIPESTNGAEHVKDSDTPECSGNQPLVASAPHMVNKTSWLSCCGLFEVLSGSNR